jgi:hypothetical protein
MAIEKNYLGAAMLIETTLLVAKFEIFPLAELAYSPENA